MKKKPPPLLPFTRDQWAEALVRAYAELNDEDFEDIWERYLELQRKAKELN